METGTLRSIEGGPPVPLEAGLERAPASRGLHAGRGGLVVRWLTELLGVRELLAVFRMRHAPTRLAVFLVGFVICTCFGAYVIFASCGIFADGLAEELAWMQLNACLIHPSIRRGMIFTMVVSYAAGFISTALLARQVCCDRTPDDRKFSPVVVVSVTASWCGNWLQNALLFTSSGLYAYLIVSGASNILVLATIPWIMGKFVHGRHVGLSSGVDGVYMLLLTFAGLYDNYTDLATALVIGTDTALGAAYFACSITSFVHWELTMLAGIHTTWLDEARDAELWIDPRRRQEARAAASGATIVGREPGVLGPRNEPPPPPSPAAPLGARPQVTLDFLAGALGQSSSDSIRSDETAAPRIGIISVDPQRATVEGQGLNGIDIELATRARLQHFLPESGGEMSYGVAESEGKGTQRPPAGPPGPIIRITHQQPARSFTPSSHAVAYGGSTATAAPPAVPAAMPDGESRESMDDITDVRTEVHELRAPDAEAPPNTVPLLRLIQWRILAFLIEVPLLVLDFVLLGGDDDVANESRTVVLIGTLFKAASMLVHGHRFVRDVIVLRNIREYEAAGRRGF